MRYETSEEQREKLVEICSALLQSGVQKSFISDLGEFGRRDQGIYELAEMWAESDNEELRETLLVDIDEAMGEWGV